MSSLIFSSVSCTTLSPVEFELFAIGCDSAAFGNQGTKKQTEDCIRLYEVAYEMAYFVFRSGTTFSYRQRVDIYFFFHFHAFGSAS